MRIVIDLQGAQTESRFRGIGRYSLSIAKSIARHRGNHEIIIALNGLFPDTIEPICADFSGLLPRHNICVWYAAGPVKEGQHGNTWRSESGELIREAFLASLQPDIVHITSLFEGYVDNGVSSIGKYIQNIPVSVSIYDLIPLLNPEHYLQSNPTYEQYYMQKVSYLQNASLLLAISESSKKEALSLGRSGELIVNISGAADAHFCEMSLSEAQCQLIHNKFGLSSPFVLYTGGADDRKNLPRLINAYAQLSEELRRAHQLVFAGRMPEASIQQFQKQAKSAGLLSDEIVFTGYISDDDLVILYNLCELYIFPSWHEGFGLPPLEAMSCGAVVIGANTTSLPEVIGLNEALFDPFSEKSIANKITQALTDKALRERLIKHGQQQAKKFTWDKSAKIAIEAFEKIHALEGSPLKTDFRTASIIRELAKISTADRPTDKDIIETAKCLDLNNKSALLFKKSVGDLNWRIEGAFDSSYSLALVNRELALALNRMGHNVALHSTEGPGDFDPSPVFLEENPLIKELHSKCYEITNSSADIVSRNIYPPRVSDMQSSIRLLHNYAWEESGFPQEWASNFNKYLDGIACTSSHVRKVMIDNGVCVQLTVCGNGVDHWERVITSQEYRIKAKQFKFLHVSSCFPRKGVDCLLQAYGEKFSSSDNVTLVIKTFPNPHNEVHQWLENERQKYPDFPDVLIIEADLHDSELKALYQLCDVLVAPSYAEGFGLPMAEAMLSDLPVITTAWSGQLDFCNSENSWLVDFEFERAQTHFGLFLSAWAKPNIKSLAKAMAEAYSSTEELRKLKAKAGKALLLRSFKWTDVAQRYFNSVDDMLKVKSYQDPKIAWLSTWNTKCGIATYSQHLIDNLPVGGVMVFAPKCDDTIVTDKENIIRNWTLGKEHNNLDQITKEITDRSLNMIVIQFNYGFYNHHELSQFIHENVAKGRHIIIVFHSTVDPDFIDEANVKLEFIKSPLKLCSRILVHSVADLNRLKIIGLIDNVALFPHGVLNYPEQSTYGNKSATPLIASYGFCLPHKGLEELVDAVSILKKLGYPMRLRLVNAEYPAPESVALVETLKDQIKQLKIEELVEFNHNYLEDNESLELLSAADLIIFAYQQTGESSSAAVRYGLATKRPVAVTPLSIFDDISTAAFRLPGTDSGSIATGITDIISSLSSGSEEARDVLSSADKWRNEFDYAAVSKRLYGMCSALLQTSQS